MNKFTKTLLSSLVLVAAISGVVATVQAHAQIGAANRPDMYVVMFHADWCGPCKIVEPNLNKAMQTLNDPGLELIVIDITDAPRTEYSANLAFDRQIVPQYNQWYGVTGFAALIDADTKRTLGCVNMMYDAGAMAKHIANLKTYAINNQSSMDLTCPQPNN